MRPWYVLLVLPLLAASASAAHDGDGLPDEAEGYACGQPRVAALVEAAGGEAGTCDDSFDYHNEHLEPGAECDASACSLVLFTRTLHEPGHNTPAVPLPPDPVPSLGPVGIPFLDPDTLVLEGYHGEEQQYCVAVSSADFPDLVGVLPTPCASLGPLRDEVQETGPTPVMPYDDLGSTPGVDEGGLGTVPAMTTDDARVQLTVRAHWDDDRLHEQASAGVAVVEPVDPFDADAVAWYAAHPDETALEVTWTVVGLDGDVVDSRSMRVPYAGQWVAALLASR